MVTQEQNVFVVLICHINSLNLNAQKNQVTWQSSVSGVTVRVQIAVLPFVIRI